MRLSRHSCHHPSLVSHRTARYSGSLSSLLVERNSAWSNVIGSSRFPPLSGHSCSASPRRSRTLADFRRCCNSTADKTLSLGGFYQRLTPVLAEYFSDLVETALDEVAVPDTAGVDVERFRDVMIADGTILWLHQPLSEEYKARHEEQAGRSSTCSTMPPRRRLNGSRSPTRKSRQYVVQNRVVTARTAHTL